MIKRKSIVGAENMHLRICSSPTSTRSISPRQGNPDGVSDEELAQALKVRRPGMCVVCCMSPASLSSRDSSTSSKHEAVTLAPCGRNCHIYRCAVSLPSQPRRFVPSINRRQLAIKIKNWP